MPRFSAEQKAEMVAAYVAGATAEAVAVQFGCSSATVGAALTAAGVQARRGPGSVRQPPKRRGTGRPTGRPVYLGDTRICRKCGRDQPWPDGFYAGQGALCKECRNQETVDRRTRLHAASPEEHGKQKVRLRKAALMRRYGLTLEEATLLYESRNECDICGGPPDAKRLYLNIDHDHETGRVRGLLCSPCNRAIGLLRDDPAILRAAAVYLERA